MWCEAWMDLQVLRSGEKVRLHAPAPYTQAAELAPRVSKRLMSDGSLDREGLGDPGRGGLAGVAQQRRLVAPLALPTATAIAIHLQ